MTTIFVTQLDFGVTEADLLKLFKQYGNVEKVSIVKDKQTNKSKGFGFVEMSNDSHAKKAIEALNGHVINGRACVVKEAQNKTKQQETTTSKPRETTVKQFSEPKISTKKKNGKNNNDSTSDGRNKKTKMNAYKKSSKNNSFIPDDDDMQEFTLFGDMQDEEIDEKDYRAYILNRDDIDEEL